MSTEIVEVPVFTDEEIRDTAAHNSAIANMARYKIITIFVDNGLDTQTSVQIKANRTNSATGSVDVGTAFSIAASDREARTMDPETTGYLPYIWIEVTCAVAPSSGSLNAFIIGRN